MSGALTVRRFSVVGEVPEGFRDLYRARLDEHAFLEPPQGLGRGEVEGWVQIHNLLDTGFSDLNQWLYEPYAVFALRVDKKALPAKLLRATLEKRCEAWCAERGVERCPANVRKEQREELEDEWFRRVLPNVRLAELCWNMNDGYLVVTTHSQAMLDRVARRFFRTFGLKLVPWAPLDWLEDAAAVQEALTLSPTSFDEEAT